MVKFLFILACAFLLLGCVQQSETTTTLQATTTLGESTTTTTVAETTTTTEEVTTTTLANRVVYACKDNFECGWESTNGCMEQSGAYWECVNVPQTVVNPAQMCTQVVVPKPTADCACMQGTCQEKKVYGVESLEDLTARLQSSVNARFATIQAMGDVGNVTFKREGDAYYANLVYNVRLPDEGRDNEIPVIKNYYSFNVRKAAIGENSKMYSQNVDVDGVRGAFQLKGETTEAVWGCYKDFYLIFFTLRQPVREYNASTDRWQEINLQEFFRTVMKACKE